jgi:DNA helicase HerA-like ATPase
MTIERLKREAVLRVGEVTEVSGQSVVVRVDRNKNASDLLFDGDVLRNISVNSYVEIRKGFVSLIGKVDGERLDDVTTRAPPSPVQKTDRNRRFLHVSLAGYIDASGRFKGGLRELPLIGNEVFIVTKDKMETVHNLVDDGRPSIKFAVTDNEGFDIAFPIDGLFNSHIAIFGNTGSGKSNTLAGLYSAFVGKLSERNAQQYQDNVRTLLLDFNGEYVGEECITRDKQVYQLSTGEAADRLPVSEGILSDIEMLSILSDATDKTQKPFLRRALRLHSRVFGGEVADPTAYFRGILQNQVEQTLRLSDKPRAFLLLDYFRTILPERNANGDPVDVHEGIEWHNQVAGFYVPNTTQYFQQRADLIPNTTVHQSCGAFAFDEDLLSRIIVFMYVQLIDDVLTNRAQNEHIAPVINRLAGRRGDIAKIFDTAAGANFWRKNFVVISLDKVNLDMRKTIPLLLTKKLYQDHKQHRNTKSLTIIIDEAHNILSTESFRESESWKDYRLETFEEIIKEGRKFGVFVTISSQRPNDISPTITSQAHNYFIHRLVNQRDLATISSAVSYIDKVSEASIPTLPVGTCIFSGVAGQMPLKLRVRPLAEGRQPRSNTLRFDGIVT